MKHTTAATTLPMSTGAHLARTGYLMTPSQVITSPETRLQYRIDRQDMMPTTNVRGTLCVTEDGAGQAEVLWFVNYDLLDASAADAVRAGISELYAAGLAGLDRLGREMK